MFSFRFQGPNDTHNCQAMQRCTTPFSEVKKNDHRHRGESAKERKIMTYQSMFLVALSHTETNDAPSKTYPRAGAFHEMYCQEPYISLCLQV